MSVQTLLRRLRQQIAYTLAVQAALHANECGFYVPMPEYRAEDQPAPARQPVAEPAWPAAAVVM